MSIFPDSTGTMAVTTSTIDDPVLPLAKEYAWDFTSNDFLLVDGKNSFVTGKEAVKVWLWKALQTPRYRYLAYSWNYGNELDSLIAQGLSTEALKSELERYLKESLLINAYITGIKNIDISIEGSKAEVSFTAETIYGEVIISV